MKVFIVFLVIYIILQTSGFPTSATDSTGLKNYQNKEKEYMKNSFPQYKDYRASREYQIRLKPDNFMQQDRVNIGMNIFDYIINNFHYDATSDLNFPNHLQENNSPTLVFNPSNIETQLAILVVYDTRSSFFTEKKMKLRTREVVSRGGDRLYSSTIKISSLDHDLVALAPLGPSNNSSRILHSKNLLEQDFHPNFSKFSRQTKVFLRQKVNYGSISDTKPIFPHLAGFVGLDERTPLKVLSENCYWTMSTNAKIASHKGKLTLSLNYKECNNSTLTNKPFVHPLQAEFSFKVKGKKKIAWKPHSLLVFQKFYDFLLSSPFNDPDSW